MGKGIKAFLIFLFFAISANADPMHVRWTFSEDKRADQEYIIEKIKEKTGVDFTGHDFYLLERRTLAGSEYHLWAQVVEGIPVMNRSLRIWRTLNSNETILVDGYLDAPKSILMSPYLKLLRHRGQSPLAMTKMFTAKDTIDAISSYIRQNPDDRVIRDIDWRDYWYEGHLVRQVIVKGRRGEHKILVQIPTGFILEAEYEEFPRSDSPQFIEVPAMVYPIYEETPSGEMQERVPVTLKRIHPTIPYGGEDPYAALKLRRYQVTHLHPVLATIQKYWDEGYWSTPELKRRARNISEGFEEMDNTFEKGLRLQGEYVTINIHPDAKDKFTGVEFPWVVSPRFLPRWQEVITDGAPSWEVFPSAALYGQVATSPDAILNRKAERLPDHNPVAYINAGFDEVQVYHAVDQFMNEFHQMGFVDLGLSTRPFHAYLFDPDIAYQDNAYYTDDTINFTTYSGANQNFARDNSTIWHEMGHGIMDRMMGDYLLLADTGGLSEGMADFLAQLIVEKVTDGKPFAGKESFRIMNQIGFHLTNEVHDDGEAYGGTMYDFLQKAIAKYGRDGVVKVSDLTLSAMRFARNHPHLTAANWYSEMLFADTMSSRYRTAGELGDLLREALAGRNFRFDDGALAKFTLLNGEDEVTNVSPGSRENPIRLNPKGDEIVKYNMAVSLTSSESYQFKYPITIRVQYEKSPLQGAIDWVGDELEVKDYVLESEKDVLRFDLEARGTCERTNREDGSCVDYVHVHVINNGETRSSAKKRFYLRIKTEQ